MNKLNFLLATLLLIVAAPLATNAQNVDLKNSTFVWTGKKVGGSHTGNISLKSANVTVQNKQLKGGNFVMDMTSLTCTDIAEAEMNKNLINHLKSDDFFSVATFGESKFEITKVVPKSNNEYLVEGTLTIKGIKHPNSLTVKAQDQGNTYLGTLIVDRSLYNVRYGSGKFFDNLGDKVIYDNFEIVFSLKLN